MTAQHTFRIPTDGVARCTCKVPFPADTPAEALVEWEKHVETVEQMDVARAAVRRERAARIEGEKAIRRLLALGVPSQTVAEVIGKDRKGGWLVSPSVIQRLGRNAHAKQPRRRRSTTTSSNAA